MKDIDLKLEHSIVDDKEFIKNIHQNYLHDLSEFNDTLQPNSMGLFDNSFIDSYYHEDNLIPLKITLDNNIIGFVFISSGQTVDYIIQDVFILRNYRNRGLGKLVVKKLFDLYSGKFGFVVLIKNEPAKLFWERCLEGLGIEYISEELISNGELCIKLIFDSRKSSQTNDENR